MFKNTTLTNDKLIVGGIVVVALIVIIMNNLSGSVNAAGAGDPVANEPAASIVNSAFTGLEQFQKSLNGDTSTGPAATVEVQPAASLPFASVGSVWSQTGGVLTRCTSIDSNLGYQGDPKEVAIWNNFAPVLKKFYFYQCATNLKLITGQ